MKPFVSVVMPVRNEESHITRCISSVLAQDYPAERTEVIVADGRSTDATRSIVEKLAADSAANGGPAISLIDNPRRIMPSAVNEGVAVARGAYVLILSGHCAIAPDYITRCIEALERTGADNVGGTFNAVGDGLIAGAIAIALTTPFGSGNAAYRRAGHEGWVETVFPGAYRRAVFDEIGPFDEELVRGQDGEFNYRLIQSGGRIWMDPSIHVTYYGRGTLRTLWRQYFQYGVFKVRLMQKRGGLPAPRQLVPPLFVFGLFAALMLSLLTHHPLWLGAVVVPYAVVNLAASIVAGRRNPRTVVVLPALFTTMHVAWGLGFIVGLWRWRRSFVSSL